MFDAQRLNEGTCIRKAKAVEEVAYILSSALSPAGVQK